MKRPPSLASLPAPLTVQHSPVSEVIPAEDVTLARGRRSAASESVPLPPGPRTMRRRTDPFDAVLNTQTEPAEGYFVLEGERVVHVTPTFSRLCGRPAHELASVTALMGLLPAEMRDALFGSLRGAPSEAISNRWETVLYHRTGRRIEVAVLLHTLEIGAGRRQTLVMVRDITGRKGSEAAQQEAEERFRATADAAALPMWVTSAAETSPPWFNRPWREFTGCWSEHETGSKSGWDTAVHPNDVRHRRELFAQARSEKGRYRCEYRLRGVNGGWYWVLEEGAPRLLPEGTFAGYVGTCLDITERKEMEAARAAALAENARLLIELRRAAAEQRTFLRDILRIVTEGRFCLCDSFADLPAKCGPFVEILLAPETLYDLRRAVERGACDAGLSPMRGFDLMLAAGEAAMNAIVHGGGGSARVLSDSQNGRVQVWIQDSGTGIALNHLHRATLEPGFTTTGTLGQGFALVLKTCDRMYLLTGTTGTTIVLEQNCEAPFGECAAGVVS